MILADSNILIYARQKRFDHLRQQLSSEIVATCSVIKIEVLGWNKIDSEETEVFECFFQQALSYDLDTRVISKTIELRKSHPKMQLGDSIIAATALVYKLQLWTANSADFKAVKGLKLHNPLVR